MKVLDLFSGIGGFSLGLERAGFETVAFCECEPFCQKVLKKHWPDVPIFDDVNNLRGSDVGPVDVICGGYPCQPFSTAGKRAGKNDDRHLWPEYLRLIREIRPAWVIAENVAGHISMGLDDVLTDLENEGYSAWTFVIPACAVDAKHRRDRLWILATNTEYNRSSKQKRKHKRPKIFNGSGKNELEPRDAMANTNSNGCNKRREGVSSTWGYGSIRNARWPIEPAVGRVANGIPDRVDRLRALGNAVVPQIPEIIGRAIMDFEKKEFSSCMQKSRY